MPASMGVPGPAYDDDLAGYFDAPAVQGVGAEYGAHDLGPAGPDKAGDAEHLSGLNLEVDVFEDPLSGQAMGREYDVAQLLVARRKELGEGSPDHQFDELAGTVDLARRQAGDVAAAAQHGHPVGDIEDLVQAVRHEQDGASLVAQLAHDAKKGLRLVVGERRRRLVHDDDRGAPQKGAGDLDDLFLGRGQAAGRLTGIDVHGYAEALQHVPRLGDGLAPREKLTAGPHSRLAAQHHVLGDAQPGHDGEFLENGHDPVAPGIARRRERHRAAFDAQSSLVGRDVPRQDLDQS